MGKLTVEERKARRAAKRAARHAKWGGPRPPWVDDVAQALAKMAPVLRDALLDLALGAVRAAAESKLAEGRDKHDAAVDEVLAGAPGFARDVAGGVVWEAYERLADAGEVD